jgi:hypothetical protein
MTEIGEASMYSEDAQLMHSILAASPLKVLLCSAGLGIVSFVLPIGAGLRRSAAQAIQRRLVKNMSAGSVPFEGAETDPAPIFPTYAEGPV